MNLIYLAMTIFIFFLLRRLLGRFAHPLANPLLWSITFFITLFSLSTLDFHDYVKANQYLLWLLEPAVVALAVPLFTQFQQIKKHLKTVLICCLGGVLVALLSGSLIAIFLGGQSQLLLSLLSKSITTPIAIEVSQQIGGIAALTAGIVIIVGVFGAMIGMKLLIIFKVTNEQAQGLAMGCSAHAVGTARSFEAGEVQGAFSSVALVLCAIFTAILAPLFAWLITMI